MQLARALGAVPAGSDRLLSPFTRTLLALCVIAAPALGGVLPEDRADVMWHNYSGGDLTVQGPSVLVQKRVGALLVGNDPLVGDRRVQLATLAVRHAVPTIYPSRAHPEAGGLMSYGSNFDDRERQAGV